VIYINIRGSVDNLSRAILDVFCPSQKLSPMSVHIFNKDFLKAVGSSQVTDLADRFSAWHLEFKDRRDPAAHRIPLSVPPAVLDQKAQQIYAGVNREYCDAFNRAIETARAGEYNQQLFDDVDSLSDRLASIGMFLPIFVHHPTEGAIKIYPTVPEDIGQVVKIARGLSEIMSAHLNARGIAPS
jgi:hypothetical protein